MAAWIPGAKLGGAAELPEGLLCKRQDRRGQEVLRPTKRRITSHEERCRIVRIEQREMLECCRERGRFGLERQRTLRQLLHSRCVELDEVCGKLRITPAKFERAG
ncbi:MAG: hypothetical protein ACXWK5_07335, partial [Myxococcaceae bacterium]